MVSKWQRQADLRCFSPAGGRPFDMANEAYATFRHPAVVPLDQVGPNQFVLELFHGPTLAFKDVAMQLISRLMDHVLAKRNQRTTIVVATSGDTGGAAVDAFAGLDNVDLVVLFPNGRISDVQRRMMTTTGAPNVHDRRRQRAVHAGGRRSDLSGTTIGCHRRHLYFLHRLRPAVPEARPPGAEKEEIGRAVLAQ